MEHAGLEEGNRLRFHHPVAPNNESEISGTLPKANFSPEADGMGFGEDEIEAAADGPWLGRRPRGADFGVML